CSSRPYAYLPSALLAVVWRRVASGCVCQLDAQPLTPPPCRSGAMSTPIITHPRYAHAGQVPFAFSSVVSPIATVLLVPSVTLAIDELLFSPKIRRTLGAVRDQASQSHDQYWTEKS